jgi:hypothetical protein
LDGGADRDVAAAEEVTAVGEVLVLSDFRIAAGLRAEAAKHTGEDAALLERVAARFADRGMRGGDPFSIAAAPTHTPAARARSGRVRA